MAFDPSKGGSSSLFQSFMGNRPAGGGGSPVFGSFGMPQQQGGGFGRPAVQPMGQMGGGPIGDWGPGGGQAPEMPIGDWGSNGGLAPEMPIGDWRSNGGLAPEPRFERPYGQGMDPMKPAPTPGGLPVQPMPRPGPGFDGLPVQPMPRPGPAPTPDRLPVQPMPRPAPVPDRLPVQPMPPTSGAGGNNGFADAVRALQAHPTNSNVLFDQSGNATTLMDFAKNYRQQMARQSQAQQPRGPSQAQLLAQQLNQNALNKWNQK